MRTLQWALVLAVPAVWAAAARSAERVFPSGTAAELILLRQKSVQEELKISPDVAKKIRDFTDKQHETARDAMKLSKEEVDKKFKQLDKENKEFLKNNLTDAQRKRLRQIAMQFTGLRQLTRKTMVKRLNLTPDQVTKFKQLQKEARKKIEKLLSAKNREGISEKFAKLREETRKKVRAVLTPAQKAKVKDIVGELFKGKIMFEGAGSEDKPDK